MRGDPTKPGLKSGRGPKNFGLAQRKIFLPTSALIEQVTDAGYTPAAGAGRRHSGAGSRVTPPSESRHWQQKGVHFRRFFGRLASKVLAKNPAVCGFAPLPRRQQNFC